ncbi:DUF7312 domain-containing protein [Salinibaculum rarum]|uniref:DUF7312 domain-containing protein n=1 Tax=Salinibaculum rarum TaxID=3058903 RepID=UPI00265D7668|nr:hypothetical protein [Salinibaculum sp. KK48]
MATDSDDEEEWRYSLSDLEDESDTASDSDGVPADEEETDDSGGIDAGVAGKMDVPEELEAQEIDLENALFVAIGVVLALAFAAGYLNLLP